MTELSDDFTVFTKEMIDEFGTAIVLKRETGDYVDPATQTFNEGTTTSDSLKAVLDDYKAHQIVDGGNIRYGDKKLIIAQSDLVNLSEPASGDIIEIASVRYKVISAVGMSAGDKYVGYEVQIRK